MQESGDRLHVGIANLGHYGEWYLGKFPQGRPSQAWS
ncbi:hypothetical protein SAI_1349 [Streptococcus agalactiae H36B]|nr:hypothetical protein SAI_1349 [Streptococcus agalactiae H36B]